jgi:hypothetical protein
VRLQAAPACEFGLVDGSRCLSDYHRGKMPRERNENKWHAQRL